MTNPRSPSAFGRMHREPIVADDDDECPDCEGEGQDASGFDCVRCMGEGIIDE